MVVHWGHTVNNRHSVPYSEIILKLATSTGSNPDFGSATIMAVSKLPLCLFPQIFSKLFNYTDLFIHSHVPIEYFLCTSIKLF